MHSLILVIIACVFLCGVFSCSLPPRTRSFTVTERTVLAPIVFQAKVLNTSIPDDSPGQIFDICVRVQRTFKSPGQVPRELCFGAFGIEELCLTYVAKGDDYVFFVNEDYTARYDGVPGSAVPATSEFVTEVEQGYCKGKTPSKRNCEPPVITQEKSEIMTRVKEGESVIVECRASGTIPFVATWYRGGQITVDKQLGNFLQITDATLSDTGRYICIVKNPAGEAAMEYQLQTLSASCGRTVGVKENASEIIQSPGFPLPYRRAKGCSWRVCPPQGMHLEFSFTTFDLRTFDKLEIINECDKQHFPWRQYCGSKLSPGTFVSRCNTTCMQIILDSGIRPNRVASGFRAVVKATEKESMDINVSEMYCKSALVAKVKPTVVFYSDFVAEVIEILRQEQPLLTENEISLSHDFSPSDMFGCFVKIEVGTEYYVFASFDEPDNGQLRMDFTVNPNHHSTPWNFVKQMEILKEQPPQCGALPA